LNSLLLGIYRNIDNSSYNQITNKLCGKIHFNLFPSKDNSEFYFIAIIDYLQLWNIKKKTELSIKSVVHEKNHISAIPPKEYANRFYFFIHSLASNNYSTGEYKLQKDHFSEIISSQNEKIVELNDQILKLNDLIFNLKNNVIEKDQKILELINIIKEKNNN
jgi:hypothetical protein